MLELIYSVSDPELMSAQRKSKTMKWRMIDFVFEGLYRTGLSRSDFTAHMSQTRGSTPLHHACFYGNVRAVEWLLLKSPQSMLVKNALGNTPSDLAKRSGHSEVLDIAAPASGARGALPIRRNSPHSSKQDPRVAWGDGD